LLTLRLAPQVYPVVAKVEDAAGSRHQGCSCSRLPQSLDNEGDAVSSAFPEGKQHGEKKPIIGNNRALYLDQSLKIATKLLYKLFYTNLTVLFMQL
jgi:hypothetical protein